MCEYNPEDCSYRIASNDPHCRMPSFIISWIRPCISELDQTGMKTSKSAASRKKYKKIENGDVENRNHVTLPKSLHVKMWLIQDVLWCLKLIH